MSDTGLDFIDVQSHFLPPVYREALRAAGLERIDDWPIPEWDPASALRNMDQLGIRAQMLSLSAPGVTFLQEQAARELSRSVNEYAAALIQEHSPRFGAFATLPLPDVEGSLTEMAYALDELKLDGVGLLSNYDGLYLGQPEFDPIFDELNRREAILFIHPVAPPNFAPLSVGLTAPILEYPFDTTRVAANLIKSGTLERCPQAAHHPGAWRWHPSVHRAKASFCLWSATCASPFPLLLRDDGCDHAWTACRPLQTRSRRKTPDGGRLPLHACRRQHAFPEELRRKRIFSRRQAIDTNQKRSIIVSADCAEA